MVKITTAIPIGIIAPAATNTATKPVSSLCHDACLPGLRNYLPSRRRLFKRHTGVRSLKHAALTRYWTTVRLRDAYLSEMENLNATIGWLYEQTAHAQRALADLKSGRHNLEILGKDKTQNLIESYERLIKECQSLIAGYKDRRDR